MKSNYEAYENARTNEWTNERWKEHQQQLEYILNSLVPICNTTEKLSTSTHAAT